MSEYLQEEERRQQQYLYQEQQRQRGNQHVQVKKVKKLTPEQQIELAKKKQQLQEEALKKKMQGYQQNLDQKANQDKHMVQQQQKEQEQQMKEYNKQLQNEYGNITQQHQHFIKKQEVPVQKQVLNPNYNPSSSSLQENSQYCNNSQNNLIQHSQYNYNYPSEEMLVSNPSFQVQKQQTPYGVQIRQAHPDDDPFQNPQELQLPELKQQQLSCGGQVHQFQQQMPQYQQFKSENIALKEVGSADEGVCIICMNEKSRYISVQCFHMVACENCINVVPPQCPKCRMNTSYKKVFL